MLWIFVPPSRKSLKPQRSQRKAAEDAKEPDRLGARPWVGYLRLKCLWLVSWMAALARRKRTLFPQW
jgi:hypothetical protein